MWGDNMKSIPLKKSLGIRIIAFILAFMLFPIDAFAEAGSDDSAEQPVSSDIKAFIIPTLDSTSGFGQKRVIFLSGGEYYMDIKDICELTRSSSSLNGNVLSIVQGIYRAEIDIDKGIYKDSCYNRWNYKPLIVSDRVCVNAIAFLTLLGAKCELKGNMLSVTRPNYTFWEAIDPNTFDYVITQDELYGGKAFKVISLTCDVLMDMLFENPLDYISGNFAQNALFDMLNNDVLKYESAQNEEIKIAKRVASASGNVDLDELSKVMSDQFKKEQDSREKIDNAFDFLSDASGNSVKVSSISSDAVSLWAQHVIIPTAKRVYRIAAENYIATDPSLEELCAKFKQEYTDAANKIAKVNKEETFTQELTNNTTYALWVFRYATNLISLTAQVNQLTGDSMYLLNEVYDKKNIEYAGLKTNDFMCYKDAQNVANLAKKGDFEKIRGVACDSYIKTLVEFAADKGMDFAMEAITGDKLFGMSFNIATFIASLCFQDEINAYKCDMMAAYDCNIECESAVIASNLSTKAIREHYCSTETMERLVITEKLFFRSLIGAYSNYKVSVNEFGTSNKDAWIAYFDKHCEYYAKIAYRLSNCKCTGLFDPSDFEDSILKGNLNQDVLKQAPETVINSRDENSEQNENTSSEYPTTYDDTMDYTNVSAYDTEHIFYKSLDGKLMRENRDGSVGRICVFDEEFITICGIDASFIYLKRTSSDGDGFNIEAVEKSGNLRKIVLNNIYSLQLMDGNYFYFTRDDQKNVLKRIHRSTFKEEDFSVFNEDVELVLKQKDSFYVLTNKDSIVSIFFGHDVRNYYIDMSGKIIKDLGESPAVQDLPTGSIDSDSKRTRYLSNGYLRTGASDVYYKLSDGSYIPTEHTSGWSYMDNGIIVAIKNRDSSSKYPYEIAYYTGGNADPKHIADVWSDQAMFTLCKSADSKYYFFDQHEDVLSFNEVQNGIQSVFKEFNSTQLNCDLNQCGATIQLDRVYFYTMVNEHDARVLDRYDVFIYNTDNVSVA